jgi:hypothetical protein
MKPTTRGQLAVAVAVLVASISACGSAPAASRPGSTATPLAAGTPIASNSSAEPANGPPSPAAPGATPPATPTGAPPVGATRTVGDGCPVSVQTLMSALTTSTTDMYKRAGRPAALRDPVCYRGFAIAGTVPDGKSQPSQIVFGFDVRATAWRPLNVGSADYCTGYVPTDIAAHLDGC